MVSVLDCFHKSLLIYVFEEHFSRPKRLAFLACALMGVFLSNAVS